MALAQGDVEDAEQALEAVRELEGEESGPYRMLDAAIRAHEVLTTLEEMRAKAAAEVGAEDSILEELEEDVFADLVAEKTAETTAGTTAGAAVETTAPPADDVEQPEPPSREDLAGLTEVREAWLVAHGPLTYIGAEDEPVELAYGGIVVQEDGLVRYVTMHDGPFDGRALYALVASACATPAGPMPACRPRTVIVGDEERALALSMQLSGTPIKVRAGDVRAAREVFATMAAAIHPEAPPTFLSDHETPEIDAFLEAARRFFDAEPWGVFDGDAIVAFRLQGAPWRYASVMGQQGEEFGVSIFESWAAVQEVVGDGSSGIEADEIAPAAARLAKAGAIESVSLGPLSYLAPADAACYVERDVQPYFDDEYPLILRFGGRDQERPRLDLAVYTGLLEAIARRAKRARIRVRSFQDEVETNSGALEVRFPATGDVESG